MYQSESQVIPFKRHSGNIWLDQKKFFDLIELFGYTQKKVQLK